LVNFLLALFIYSMCLFYWGDEYVGVKDMNLGMKFNKEAKSLGFRDGDILLGTDKAEFKGFDADLFRDISTAHWTDVVREGKKTRIYLPGDINLLGMLKAEPQFVRPLVPARVDSVVSGSVAQKIGLRGGDRIVALNGVNVESYNDFQYEIGRRRDMLAAAHTRGDSIKAQSVTIAFVHDGEQAADTCKAKATLSGNLEFGFYVRPLYSYYKPTHISYGFLESFPAGIKYGWNVLAGYVGDMKYVFTTDGAKSLGGFGAIGSLFPPMWDWHTFWLMTAFLSIILAFMNILPIPALDGGHVLFLLYEMITRRKPSETFMIRAEYVGIGVLLLLMVVANLNDILRFLGYM